MPVTRTGGEFISLWTSLSVIYLLLCVANIRGDGSDVVDGVTGTVAGTIAADYNFTEGLEQPTAVLSEEDKTLEYIAKVCSENCQNQVSNFILTALLHNFFLA